MSAASRARRDTKRRLEELAPEIDRAVESDKRFFERHPHRSHRVRLASLAEVRANEAVHGRDAVACPLGVRWYCVVRQVEPGFRLRNFARNAVDIETDMTEAEARSIWDFLAGSGSAVREVEKQLKAALAKRGAE